VEAHPIPLISPRPHLPTRRLVTLVTRQVPPTRDDWDAVERLTHYLIDYTCNLSINTIVVASVQCRERLTPTVCEAFRRLATCVPYVALLGAGLDDDTVEGVRGVPLTPTDPLTSEWILASIGLQDNIALVAADLGDDNDAPHRQYDIAVSYDPAIVTDIARALLARI
jgi:hypothetical protein